MLFFPGGVATPGVPLMPLGRTARRLGWMMALWAASVAAMAAIGYAIRLVLL